MKKSIFFVMFFCAVYSLSAYPQNIPPGDQPGAEAARFQQESQRIKESQKKKDKATIEIAPEKEAEPSDESVKFLLKGVNITGVTVFKPEDFAPAYTAYLDKEISLKDVDAIISSIKSKYKKYGYLTTTAYFPEQDIASGVIEIKVIEGKLGDLSVEGNKNFSSSVIKKYIHSKKNEILNIRTLSRDILRLNQNSDLEIKTVIDKGSIPETSDVVLKIDDKTPYHIGANVDNQGTRLVGKYRTFATFRSTNLTGNMDSFFVSTMMSERAYGNYTSYLFPVTTYGTKLGMDFSYFTNSLGKEYKAYNIRGYTQVYTPHILFELALSETFQANLDMGLEIKSIKKYMKKDKTSDDQLRLPYIGFSISNMDGFFGGGQTIFNPKFVFGTARFLGASDDDNGKAGRAGTGGFFFKYEQSVQRMQIMPFESYIQARSQFQASVNSLSSSEQLQLGGMSSVRGYPEGDYLCDTGATLNIDWFFPAYIIPKNIKLPKSQTPLRNQIQPVIFMDLAGGSLKKAMPGETKEKFLMGIGGGVKVNLYNSLSLRFDWAKDIGEKPVSGTGPSTFYFSIQSEI